MDTGETSPKQPATLKCIIHLIHSVNLQDSLYGHKWPQNGFQLCTFVPVKENLGSDLNIVAKKQ